jgi:tRNA(fMet)-specific endonuclease VapC
MIVLDTSTLSRAMRRDAAVLAHASRHPPGQLILTAPVAAEIWYGLERLPQTAKRRTLLTAEFHRWRQVLRWQAWEEAAAEMFGRQKADLEARGQLVDDWDIAIGASALIQRASVATCNPRHFSRLRGLDVLDWSKIPRPDKLSADPCVTG